MTGLQNHQGWRSFLDLEAKTTEARFIFDNEEIPEYINEVYSKASTMYTCNKLLDPRKNTPQDIFNKYIAKQEEIYNWVEGQHSRANELFKEELNVNEK